MRVCRHRRAPRQPTAPTAADPPRVRSRRVRRSAASRPARRYAARRAPPASGHAGRRRRSPSTPCTTRWSTAATTAATSAASAKAALTQYPPRGPKPPTRRGCARARTAAHPRPALRACGSAGAECTGGIVHAVAELGHRGEHALLGVGGDVGVVVQHPRHGLPGHACAGGDVADADGSAAAAARVTHSDECTTPGPTRPAAVPLW